MSWAETACSAIFPPVQLPKSVAIHNRRLAVLYRLLQLGALVLAICIISSGDTYVRVEVPIGSIANWIDWKPDEYDEQVRRDLANDICVRPGKYDYVYDEGLSYENMTCVELSEFHRSFKDGQEAAYIPTSFRETHQRFRALPANAGAEFAACNSITEPCAGGWQLRRVTGVPGQTQACECKEQSYHTVMGLEALRVNLEHNYEVFRNDGKLGSRQHSGMMCRSGFWRCEDEHTKEDLRTIITVSKNNSERERIHPVFDAPGPIHFNLGQILETAGISLDGFNTDTLENLLVCNSTRRNASTSGIECREDVERFPLLRATGLRLKVKLMYYNRRKFPEYEELKDHNGPVCIINIAVVPRWSSRPKADCDQPRLMASPEADCTQRYYYGIAMSFTASGEFGYVDPMLVLVTIGATLSYFTVPFVIIQFVCMFLMGPVSAFYRSFLVRPLTANGAFCALVCKAMGAAASFRTLVGSDSKGMTKDMIFGYVQRIFGDDRDFPVEEQAPLAELVYDRLREEDGKVEGEEIPMQAFVQGAVVPRGMDAALTKLFEEDRTRSPIEYLLAPRDQLQAKDKGGADLRCRVAGRPAAPEEGPGPAPTEEGAGPDLA